MEFNINIKPLTELILTYYPWGIVTFAPKIFLQEMEQNPGNDIAHYIL